MTTTRKPTRQSRTARRPVTTNESPSNADELEEEEMADEETVENAPEDEGNVEEAAGEEPTPEEAVDEHAEALAAHGWVTDEFGNAATPSVPARPLVMGHRFYDFNYVEDEVNKDTIRPTEDVYAVINYPGSKRTGAALAYPAGSAVPATILNAIETDTSGRYGPSKA